MSNKYREVDDIILHGFKSLIQVRFKDEMEIWWPVLIDDVGKRLREIRSVDFYDPETKRVGIEEMIDLVYDRQTQQYEPIYKVVSQDIRAYLHGCGWDQLNRIFSTVKQ